MKIHELNPAMVKRARKVVFEEKIIITCRRKKDMCAMSSNPRIGCGPCILHHFNQRGRALGMKAEII